MSATRIRNDADTVRGALAFGRSNDDLQPQSFWDEARVALARMEDLICTLLAEREFGPQPFVCPNPECPVVSLGSGYTNCPRCEAPLLIADIPSHREGEA